MNDININPIEIADDIANGEANSPAALLARNAILEAQLKAARETIANKAEMENARIKELEARLKEAEGDIEELTFCEDCGEDDTRLKENNCWPPRYCHSCRHKLVTEICELRKEAKARRDDCINVIDKLEAAEARLKEAQAEERDYETLRGYFDAAQADAGRLRAALEKLLDAHARARKAEDAVDRDPENGDLDEFEDAFACLIICENEARELLTAEAVKSEAK